MAQRKRLKHEPLIRTPSEIHVVAQRKKVKKRKPDDGAYHPSQSKPSNKSRSTKQKAKKANILHHRANTAKEVVVKGEKQAYKFAAVADIKGFQFTDEDIREQLLNDPCPSPTTPTQRKIVGITCSENGSPLEATTVGGTKMPCTKKIKPVYFFENRFEDASPDDDKKIVSVINEDHPFYQSKQYEDIKQLHLARKEQQVEITAQLLRKSYLTRKRMDFIRSESQNEVMSRKRRKNEGSAQQYADAANLASIPGIKWEWLHLVAYGIVNAEGQVMDNIAGGTEFANTDMMLIEAEISLLAEKYPEGFTLNVKSNHIKIQKENVSDDDSEHLQIATTIQYFIETKDFSLEFTFNAQSHRQPHIAFRRYMRSLFETLVAYCQHKNSGQESQPVKAKGLQFFDRDRVLKDQSVPTADREFKLK